MARTQPKLVFLTFTHYRIITYFFLLFPYLFDPNENIAGKILDDKEKKLATTLSIKIFSFSLRIIFSEIIIQFLLKFSEYAKYPS